MRPVSSGASVSGPSNYDQAREAAEDQNYLVAINYYQQVLQEFPRGKSGAEVRLEFAKVLLFADQPARAKQVADSVPGLTFNRELRGRAALLSVIAQHVQHEAYLAKRPPYVEGRDRSRAVYAQMEAVYEKSGKYDDDAIIPARIRVLRESLAELELRQMQAERDQGKASIAAQRARYILIEFADTDAVRRNARLLRGLSN
jgi:outer membrane protein assembly factor BamD (BamD/ComL family)